jgi:hypothetical protein
MDGQRQSTRAGRKRPRRSRDEQSGKQQPVLIAARRPDAPLAPPQRRFIAASAVPKRAAGLASSVPSESRKAVTAEETPQKRTARIVQVSANGPDERERLRLRLLERLLASDGRVDISRAANDFVAAGFEFPVAQDVQLQLLEHFDEARASQALTHLCELLRTERPIKRPVFEQRLKRLEEFGEDLRTREIAAELRRSVRM